MKCQFRNKWTPHVEFRSGENSADMISRVVSKVWAERRNIEFKKKGKPLTAMPNECPTSFEPLEKPTFVSFWNHPILRCSKPVHRRDGRPLPIGNSILKQVMSRQQQRALKKSSAKITDAGNQKVDHQRLLIAHFHAVQLRCSNKLQLAMLAKDSNPLLFKKLMDELEEGLSGADNNVAIDGAVSEIDIVSLNDNDTNTTSINTDDVADEDSEKDTDDDNTN